MCINNFFLNLLSVIHKFSRIMVMHRHFSIMNITIVIMNSVTSGLENSVDPEEKVIMSHNNFYAVFESIVIK